MSIRSPRVLVLLPFVLCACSDDEPAGVQLPSNTSAAIVGYGAIVRATYEDSLAGARALETAIDTFIAAPSEANLTAARDAWLASREPYLQSEVFRFYEGPIDNAEDGPEGMINAWPMDEAFVDYVDGMPTSGLVNDLSITIDRPTLEGLNESGGATENVATGFHPIEFMLWGQDQSTTGPGARPYTDYVTGSGGTAMNQARRAMYLDTLASMLVEHIEHVHDHWAPGVEYRAELEAATPKAGLTRILTGMIVLSGFELGGERVQAALDSGDQEDEHSCFSDNTHRDMIQDARGVQNVYLGRYRRTDGTLVTGTGVYDVVAAVDQSLADTLRDRIATSVTTAEAMMPPFDQEIAIANTVGRARVQALVSSLRTQEQLLTQVFVKLGLTVPAPPG